MDIADKVSLMSIEQRNARLDSLIEESHAILDEAINSVGYREIKGIVGLFSGGNDSTTLAHMFRMRVTHYGHSNTMIGIEQTRQYVRDTAFKWNVPLLERFPWQNETFEDLVLGKIRSTAPWAKYEFVWPGGFPGASQHAMVFQRIKERGMMQMRNELIDQGMNRHQRVIFIAGRRKEESKRRKARALLGELKEVETRGTVVWCSPLINWTKLDLMLYRKRFRVPRNEVSDLLHMSGECLCGCYAHKGEFEEIEFWFPEVTEYIKELERRVKRRRSRLDLDFPVKYCTWGWNDKGRCATGLCNN